VIVNFDHQVDLDVLAELPEDIQRQLQKAMTDRQRSRPPGGNILPGHDSDQPGCSHWPSDQHDDREDIPVEVTRVTGGERSSKAESESADLSLNSQPIVALPSYSQVRFISVETINGKHYQNILYLVMYIINMHVHVHTHPQIWYSYVLICW